MRSIGRSWGRSILVPSADRGAKSGARYGRRPRRSTTVFSRARPLRWKTIPGRSCATAVLRKRFSRRILRPSAMRRARSSPISPLLSRPAIKEKAERDRAERALRESEARLQAAVDLVKLGRYSWNPQTNELEWDEKCRAMWGLPADATVDYDTWRTTVHPDDLGAVEAAIQRCADPQGDGVYDLEYRVLRQRRQRALDRDAWPDAVRE